MAPLYKEKAEIWAAMPENIITHLPSLRKLTIWLDHIQKPYWSVVHERHVLRPFEQLANLSHLDLSFDLPKLKPRVGGPHRLFLEGEDGGGLQFHPSSQPVQIRRRLRQRHRVVGVDDAGAPRVLYYHDFPLGLGFSIWKGLTVAQIEASEIALERSGVNIPQLLSQSSSDMTIPAMASWTFGSPHALQDHHHLVVD
ncbi:hypothetical protein PG991_000101 [Apiospora marii]|uniref:Uncharacterized protein n=2 Tax=Apiospora marii TaxID=335849 RepID=A0ABR1T155_9PEZI